MVFKIDGIVCPLADDVQLPMYNAKRLRSVESWREGDTLRVRVSSTTEVDRLFGFALDLHRASDFNDSYHHAELIVDGVVLGKVDPAISRGYRTADKILCFFLVEKGSDLLVDLFFGDIY